MVGYRLSKKISVKTVCGKISVPRYVEGDHLGEVIPGEEQWLMDVVGYCNGTKTGQTDKGDWTALLGGFQARNLRDNSVYRSGVCFLPDVILNSILPALQANEGAMTQFAVRIGAKSDPDAATGYVYMAETLMDAGEADPLEAILAKLPGTGAVQLADQSENVPEEIPDTADETAPKEKRRGRA